MPDHNTIEQVVASAEDSSRTNAPLLSLAISVDYVGKPGVLRDLRLEMQPGEILGLVGESGSGKSTLALSILRLLELKGGKASGSILLKGRELTTLSESEMRRMSCRDTGSIMQGLMSPLNPALKIGTQM